MGNHFDIGYFKKPVKVRAKVAKERTVINKMNAWGLGKEYYDGSRLNGYGGFKYDGRWKKIAKKIYEEYNLNDKSSFLQLSCEKGFLLKDLKDLNSNTKITGLETSDYAISACETGIKENIKKCDNYINLEYKDKQFDFVIALGVVYTLNLTDAIRCLKEIQRVSKGKSFVTLASYKDIEDYWLFKQWTVLGTIILREEEWIEILNHINFTGDYFFTNTSTLNLKQK